MKQTWIDDQGFGVVPLGRWAPLWSDNVIIAASLWQSSTVNWSSCERNGSREASPAERSRFKDNEWAYVKTVPEVDLVNPWWWCWWWEYFHVNFTFHLIKAFISILYSSIFMGVLKTVFLPRSHQETDTRPIPDRSNNFITSNGKKSAGSLCGVGRAVWLRYCKCH